MLKSTHVQASHARKTPWAVVTSLAWAFGLTAGCKLQRSQLRSAESTPPAPAISAPKTLRGSFSMLFEPSAGKKFPIHMSFVLDFAKGGAAAVFSSCLESDGGLAKSDATKEIEPDRAIPVGVDAATADAAVGLQNSTLACAAQVPLADRLAGLKGGTPPAAADANASSGSSLQTSLTEASATAPAPADPLAAQTTPAQGQSNPQAGTGSAPAGERTIAPDDKGLFTFTSKPDKTGKSIRFTLRANDAGWHVESLEYFGVPAFVAATETVAMHE